jgi:3-hydroxybutyryl-CoA dehydrogenase
MNNVINILGCGVMGRQIAALLTCLNYDVHIFDRSINEQKKKLLGLSQKILARKFNLKCDFSNINFTKNIEQIQPGLVYETVAENLDVKRGLLKKIGFDIEEGKLLTNSSSFLPSEIHPNAVGFHFFNPIHAIRLVEFSTQFSENNEELEILIAGLVEKLDFDVVNVKENRGYIGNFILFHEISNALKLIDVYGYNLKDIERVSSFIGKTYSVFEVIDLVGVDVTKFIIENLKQENESIYLSPSLENAITAGVLGKKNKTSFRKFIL